MQTLLRFFYNSWALIVTATVIITVVTFLYSGKKLKEAIQKSPYKEIAAIAVILVCISGYVELSYTSVPCVEGFLFETAVSTLRNANLNGALAPNTGYKKDEQIFYQSIATGTIVKKGETVALSYNKETIIQPSIITPQNGTTPHSAQYEMEVYVTQESYEPYRRNFRDYSVQGTNEVYSTRDTYGEKHITFTVTEDQLAQAAVYSPGATIPEDNSGMFVGGINKSNKDAYVMQIPLYDGRYYPLFIKAKIG